MAAIRQESFRDRADAGEQLAAALRAYRGTHPLVLVIPRGGVPIGRIVAEALDGELDLALVHKLGAPRNSEFAIGAVDEAGHVTLGSGARAAGADAAYVSREAAAQLALIRDRRARYRPHVAPSDPAGRTVIVVDDGLATGATMRAALAAVRARSPARLVCAVPVAAPDALAELAALADEVVCLSAPEDFHAVSQFYRQFPAVEDRQVMQLLGVSATPRGTAVGEGQPVQITVEGATLQGELTVPAHPIGLVIFSHGNGSSRLSPRNRAVAQMLNRSAMATLLFDLLGAEEAFDRRLRFDVALLASRLSATLRWTRQQPAVRDLPVALFGSSTGAAAALRVAADHASKVAAIVSRGGRPDLAGVDALSRVSAPTLLIVGSADTEVVTLNQQAAGCLGGTAKVVTVPGATHLFEEPGALEQVAALATAWFERWFAA